MPPLTIFRGLPASGKTTLARRMLATRELGSIVRLNRDDLRRMGIDPEYRRPVHHAEQAITILRDSALGALLESGVDVIVDDTNMRAKYMRGLMRIAESVGADVEIIDCTDIPLDECIRRDSLREGPERVGEAVIRDMHSRYIASLNGKPLPVPELPNPVRPEWYVPVPGAPKAVIVDLDGTVALLDRSPYDETLVHTDRPNIAVIEAVRALVEADLWPVFMSGRTEGCRHETEQWLIKHVGEWTVPVSESSPILFMRAIGDTRPDHVVKLELFDRHVRTCYDVRMILDDRDSVVRLWRSFGLACFQVAPGNF